ncbi:hypothetical protein V9K92_14980 [Phyllobacterium sp. CCNWLW109]|uniref:hypothetical protein n=1 Tax=Phyllobacterium sp. CCNWLW109 TaxID=3127479 RepID=UPI0030789ADD
MTATNVQTNLTVFKPYQAGEAKRMPRLNNEGFAGSLHHCIVRMHHPVHAIPLPTLWLLNPKESDTGPPMLFVPLIDYFVGRSSQAYATHIKSSKMIGWLWDYLHQRREYFEARQAELGENASSVLINEFINHLKNGTVIPGPHGPHDETGLYWKPCPSIELLAGYAVALDRFLDNFGSRTVGAQYDEVKSLLPKSALDTISLVRMARANSGFSILEHLRDRDELPQRQNKWIYSLIIGKDSRNYNATPVKRFPQHLLVPMLTEGFVIDPGKPSEREDATGRMHAALGTGGLRGSEPLHLWVNDLQIVDDRLIGFLRHPVFFRDGGKRRNRQTILLEDYGLLPRNMRSGRFQAGWKGLALGEEQFAEIQWMPLEGIQEFLQQEFAHYLVNVRNPVMRKRAWLGLPDHPYFLVCAREIPALGVHIGDPYTKAAARGSWERAINRLSLLHPGEEIVLEKNRGTTRHGIRHLYGYLLRSLGFDEAFIQRAMHHRHIMSSRVYTAYDDAEVHASLEAAKEFLKTHNNQNHLPHFPSLSTSLDQMFTRAVGGW